MTNVWSWVAAAVVCAGACGGTGDALGPRGDEAPPGDEGERALVYAASPGGDPVDDGVAPVTPAEDAPDDGGGDGAAAFAEAERAFEAIGAIDASGPPAPSELSAWVSTRTNAVATAVAAYARVVGAGEPAWAVAAYVRMGECYRDLGEALATMPAPEGVPEEHLANYREQLEGYRGPMMETARELWRNARELANREGLRTTWSARAEALLAGAE